MEDEDLIRLAVEQFETEEVQTNLLIEMEQISLEDTLDFDMMEHDNWGASGVLTHISF